MNKEATKMEKHRHNDLRNYFFGLKANLSEVPKVPCRPKTGDCRTQTLKEEGEATGVCSQPLT